MLERFFSHLKRKLTEVDLRQNRLDELGLGTLPVRKQIDALYYQYRYQRNEWVNHLPSEITMLVPPDERYGEWWDRSMLSGTMGHDCNAYVLKGSLAMEFLPNRYFEAKDPEKANVVLYISTDEYKRVNHIGKYDKNGHVTSRWGEGGPILKHPIHFVPTGYGDVVSFLKIPEELIK